MDREIKKKCKWCYAFVDAKDLQEHEENCDLNDGGRGDMNYEDIDNYFYKDGL